MPSKTKNLNQNSRSNKNQKRSFKKEPFSLMTVKTLLVILIFTALGTIIIGGVYIIGEYHKKTLRNNIVIFDSDKIKDPAIVNSFLQSAEILRISLPIEIEKMLFYSDGGTTGVIIKDADEKYFFFCLDGRMQETKIGEEPEPYHIYFKATHPTNANAQKIPISGEKEKAILNILQDWADKQVSKEEQARLINTRTVVGLSEEELKIYRILKVIKKLEDRNRIIDQLDTSDWQTYRNEEFGFEMKYPKYYFENKYDLENMTDLDYERIHFFRDMNNNELNDFKEHYITSLHEGGTHSGTIDIKSYNENELKNWYAIDSFNDLKFKEYNNFKVYILEIREVGFYYIISYNNAGNLYFVFNIPTSLQNNFENNWLNTFKFTNQNTNIEDIVKENKKIEYLKDFKFQNLPDYVFQEQKGETYKLENYIFQFIRQPNSNTPLSISSSDIKYKGVLYSKDNGSSWSDFFVIDNPTDYNDNEVKYNPVGMFMKNNKLYLDISDDRGAGSGEGNLLRYYTEDGEIWTRDSCLYLIPELYFNGSDGIDPFTITGNSDCVYSPVSLCDDEPFGTAIGGNVYPIDLKYKKLHFLGQLFTAADCGQERLSQIDGVDGENYTLGPRIVLKNNPSQELVNVFKSIGFNCCDKVLNDECKEWSHDNYSIKINELLKLEPYHKNFNRDDCINCG